jgi:hypothetical protein
MTELKKIAGTKTFLLIGDSKLISYDNVAAIPGEGCSARITMSCTKPTTWRPWSRG